jgi:hypothetical protein
MTVVFDPFFSFGNGQRLANLALGSAVYFQRSEIQFGQSASALNVPQSAAHRTVSSQ